MVTKITARTGQSVLLEERGEGEGKGPRWGIVHLHCLEVYNDAIDCKISSKILRSK